MTFELLEKKYLKNINTTGFVYEHKKTKAKLVFLQNDDVNKAFDITFKTIPYSDNDIFHILEHSVLCGSEKYPVKEPFVELIKGSFNTFLNAMTFPDKTTYPVASKNNEDLKILMDIYLDAVFNPKILTEPNILSQEGWHYHLENKEDPLIYKGVVYNEMKGVYSSVDEILEQRLTENLFSETPYKFSSGGKPEAIPTISQEEFLETYKYNYHPSNSCIVLYGDMNITDYLQHIDNYLSSYDYKDYSDYKIANQQTFNKNIVKSSYFSENTTNKNYVAYSYIIGEATDQLTNANISIIDEVLLGNSNTKFRKYFIDNKICEDVYGYATKDRKEATYTIIFKNVADEYLDSLDEKYKKLLAEIVTDGFDYEQVQATINKNAFNIKEEINKTSSPKGVNYAVRIARSWVYGEQDLLSVFDLDTVLNNLQKNCDEKKYEDIARALLIDNEKTAILQLIPTTKKEDEEEHNLEQYKSTLSTKEIAELVEETHKLLEWQQQEDKKEDLEKIKSVDAKKVNLKNPYLSPKVRLINNITYTHFDIVTNGISYSKLLFNITDFNKKQLQYASLLSYLMFNINTKNKSELEIAKEIDFNLGNITANVEVYRQYEEQEQPEELDVFFTISAKNLVEKTAKLMEILGETTLNGDFSNKDTLYNLLLEIKLMLESKFKNAGHSFVAKRLASYRTLSGKINDLITEYGFYQFIENLLEDFDKNYEAISNNLLNVTKLIFVRARLLVSFTGSEEEYNNFEKLFELYAKHLEDEIKKQSGIKLQLKDRNYSEGFYFDSLVNYVGLSYNINSYSGSHLVLRHIIGLDYLWSNVRVRNGAYGAGIVFSPFKSATLWSYRDPNTAETLDIYYNIDKYIKNLKIDNTMLNKYIIGTLNSFDTLMSPNGRANYSLTKYITNSPESLFDNYVEEIKNTTLEDLISLADEFKNVKDNSNKCILGSKESIYDNEKLFDEIIEIK